MELRELRAFVAVVEEGGLSAAARRLHVSQSALSETVQGLERQLGVELLTRSHSGVRPTTAGLLLQGEARDLLAHHDRVVALIGGSRSDVGPLRIGVPLEFPVDILPAALRRSGSARVEVRHSASTAQLAALRAGELDVALVRDRPADPSLDAVLAVEEPMGVLLPSRLAEQLGTEDGVRLDRLAGLTWIGFARSDTPAWHDQVTAILRGHGVVVDDAAPTGDGPVTAEVKLASLGDTAFTLAAPQWSHPLPEGVVRRGLVGSPIVRRTWAVWRAAESRRDLAALIAALDLAG